MTSDGLIKSRLHPRVHRLGSMLDTVWAKGPDRLLSTDEQSGLVMELDGLVADLAAEVGALESPGQAVSELLEPVAPFFRATELGRALAAVGEAKTVGEDACHTVWVDSDEMTGPAVLDRWMKSQRSMAIFAALPDVCMRTTGRMADRVTEGAIWVLGVEHPRVSFGLNQAGGNRVIVPVPRRFWFNLAELSEAPALVMLPNVLEWLSDEQVTELLTSLRTRLVSGGCVIMSTLNPGLDDSFFETVFRWEVRRRSPSELEQLLMLSELEVLLDVPSESGGSVAVLKVRGDTITVAHLA